MSDTLPLPQIDTPPPFALESPPEPAKGRLLRAARKRHDTFSALLAQGSAGLADADFVHDVRVGARRLGEAARLLKPFMDKPTAKAVDASLKAVRRAMGELRDADVTREHLLKWRMPAPLKHVALEIAELHAGGREGLAAAAQQQMTSASLTGTMVVLARILEDRALPEVAGETERQLRGTLEVLVKKRDKKLRQSFGQAAKKQTAASLHASRIAVKKLRYLLELAADAGTQRGAKKKIQFLKQLQELLGAHHDVHVIAGQLEEHLKDRREKPIKSLTPAWRKWMRLMNTAQSKRASVFFARTYAWING